MTRRAGCTWSASTAGCPTRTRRRSVVLDVERYATERTTRSTPVCAGECAETRNDQAREQSRRAGGLDRRDDPVVSAGEAHVVEALSHEPDGDRAESGVDELRAGQCGHRPHGSNLQPCRVTDLCGLLPGAEVVHRLALPFPCGMREVSSPRRPVRRVPSSAMRLVPARPRAFPPRPRALRRERAHRCRARCRAGGATAGQAGPRGGGERQRSHHDEGGRAGLRQWKAEEHRGDPTRFAPRMPVARAGRTPRSPAGSPSEQDGQRGQPAQVAVRDILDRALILVGRTHLVRVDRATGRVSRSARAALAARIECDPWACTR